jgi:FkbM family methyltransferase
MSLARLFRRRQPIPFAQWGWQINDYRLPRDGHVQYAQWLHPYMKADKAPFVVKQAEVDGLRQWISEGDFAIDIGAHCGDTTVPMALAAGRSGCVLGLEPNRYAFAVLEQNARLNPGATRIEARCFAATAEDGQFEFLYSDASFCNGGIRTRRWNPWKKKFPLSVEGRNLLNVLCTEFAERLPRLAYVKVDAEGHDLAILKSILPVIHKRRPVVRAEVFKKLSAATRQEMYDLFAEAGYAVFRFGGGESPVGAPIARGDMTRTRHFDILAIPPHRAARRAA